MITIQEAVAAAQKALSEIYGEGVAQDTLLEEVESSSDGNDWVITLSFSVPTGKVNVVPVMFGLPSVAGRERVYKSFVIKKFNGEVKAMKIRVL